MSTPCWDLETELNSSNANQATVQYIATGRNGGRLSVILMPLFTSGNRRCSWSITDLFHSTANNHVYIATFILALFFKRRTNPFRRIPMLRDLGDKQTASGRQMEERVSR
jgi:hypothetical protein